VLSVWPSSSASTSHNSTHLKICLYFHHTLINSQIRQKSSSQNHESSLNYSRSDERRGKRLSWTCSFANLEVALISTLWWHLVPTLITILRPREREAQTRWSTWTPKEDWYEIALSPSLCPPTEILPCRTLFIPYIQKLKPSIIFWVYVESTVYMCVPYS